MTHETESALRARILELENGNAYLHDVMERAEAEYEKEIAELQTVNSEQADKIVDLQNENAELKRQVKAVESDHITCLNSAARLVNEVDALKIKRDEHLRSIAELIGEKAELVEHSGVLERLTKELTAEKLELVDALRYAKTLEQIILDPSRRRGFTERVTAVLAKYEK